jgi:hypothetical protein
MSSFFRKLGNLFTYMAWTDCKHPNWKPIGMIDWECENKCGAWAEGKKPN